MLTKFWQPNKKYLKYKSTFMTPTEQQTQLLQELQFQSCLGRKEGDQGQFMKAR